MVRVMSDKEAVQAVYEQFLSIALVAADPPDPEHPILAASTTGAMLSRLREALTNRRDLGARSVGGFRSSIVSIELDIDRATVLDCSLDETVGVTSTGERGEADTGWRLRSSQVVRTAAGWRVAELVLGDPCVPSS
jgi:hypothetical protein